MKDILNKIESVYNDLVKREEVLSVKEKNCKDDEGYIVDYKHKLDARETSINARERIVAKLESVIDIQKDIDSKRVQLGIDKQELEQKQYKVSADIITNKNLVAESKIQLQLIANKTIALKKREQAHNDKLKELKSGLLGKLEKEILG